jgi:hypothetical protein
MKEIEVKFLAAISFCFAMIAGAAASAAEPQPSWDGTWVGNWEGGHGTQIIFAGDDLIGVYWDNDYLEDTKGTMSKNGLTVTIVWGGGEAVLTRDGAATAHAVFHEKGKPDVAFAVKRDE